MTLHEGAQARRVLLGSTGGAVALLAVAPRPAAALRVLAEPPAGDPSALVVALAALLGWALAGWLLLVVALAAGARGGGAPGRLLGRAAGRLAPASGRRVLELALGVTLGVAVLSGPAAAGGTAPPPAAAAGPAAVPSLDHPGLTPPATPAPEPARTAVPARPQEVVVQPGDSLWVLAERALAARDPGRAVTDARVAQEWPAWWSANREAVGADPDLLLPGTRLTPPSR